MSIQNWRIAFRNSTFSLYFSLGIVGFLIFISTVSSYFNKIILPKPGIQLNDPILALFTPYDWSILIFILIFGAPLFFFLYNYKKPYSILMIIQCYVIVNFLRMLTIYIFTLEAPIGIIPLKDPFLERFAYGGNPTFNKDLFFSGHTSFLFIMFLVEEKQLPKNILLACTLLIGLLLIWQHVHYSIDIIGAIIVPWGVFKVVKYINQQSNFNLKLN